MGWSADSISGNAATIEKIKGKTLVFNQQMKVDFMDASKWNCYSGTATFSNNEVSVIGAVGRNGIKIENTSDELTLIAGHKYFVTFDYKASVDIQVYAVGIIALSAKDNWFTYSAILNRADTQLYTNLDIFPAIVGAVGDFSLRRINVFDLTQLFGAGNEPATVEEFRAMFPLDYYDYNPGELISFNGTGLQTTGFNQFDKDNATIYNRYLAVSYSDWEPSSDSRSVAFPCLPNMDYYIGFSGKAKPSIFRVCSINAELPTVSSTVAIPVDKKIVQPDTNYCVYRTGSNSKYIIVQVSTNVISEYVEALCANLSWSGIRNGEYEPYWQRQLALPIATYFPDGMKSAGTVYDELTKDKAVKRIGDAKIRDLAINTFDLASGHLFVMTVPNIKPSEKQSMLGNAICVPFKTDYYSNLITQGNNNIMCVIWEASEQAGKIWALCNDYSTVGEFKNAYGDYHIYYELTEPVITPISPELNLTYKADDFGTEMLLPQNTTEPVTTPMDADIVYQLDYEAQVRNNGQINISKASMDNFIASFNASGLGTITQTYNPNTKQYEYTVTAPQSEPTEGGETA